MATRLTSTYSRQGSTYNGPQRYQSSTLCSIGETRGVIYIPEDASPLISLCSDIVPMYDRKQVPAYEGAPTISDDLLKSYIGWEETIDFHQAAAQTESAQEEKKSEDNHQLPTEAIIEDDSVLFGRS